MKNMKRSLIFLLLIALLMPLCGQAKQQYYTITEVREQAAHGWQQTYTAHGRTIEVDVPISVPEAQFAPVLRLAQGAAVAQLPATADYAAAVPGGFGLSLNDPMWLNYGQQSGMRYRLPPGHSHVWLVPKQPWDMTRAYADENPYTLGEAVTFVKSLTSSYANGAADMELFSMQVIRSGKSVKGGSIITQVDPPYGVGTYDLRFKQVIDGWMVVDNVTQHASDRMKTTWAEQPRTGTEVRIASDHAYTIGSSWLDVETVLAEDVPLCSLEKVLSSFEQLIDEGRLREVLGLRLGYALFLVPGMEGVVVAYPCWLLEGILQESARANTSPAFANQPPQQRPEFKYLLANAQTGELLGPEIRTRTELDAPAIIRWEDVGGR